MMFTWKFRIVFIYSICTLCVALYMPKNGGKILMRNEINTTYDEDDASFDKLPANGEIFEGDLLMDNRLRKAVWGQNSKKSTALHTDDEFKWPHGIIYYTFDATFSLVSQRMLKETIRQYEMRTCIRFKKWRQEKDYIVFTSKSEGCFSNVGRIGGPQLVNLEKRCRRTGTFEHELMHVLGFIHEHSRPDRDRYIKLHYENIKKEDLNNFKKYRFSDNLNEKFNFASVMLYSSFAFTKNGKKTIEAVGEPELKFGQRTRFSIGDIKQINNLYNCKHYQLHPFYAGLFGEYHGREEQSEFGMINNLIEQYIPWI